MFICTIFSRNSEKRQFKVKIKVYTAYRKQDHAHVGAVLLIS